MVAATKNQTTSGERARRIMSRSAEQFGLPVLFVVMVLFFATYSTSQRAFTSSANINNILAGQSVTGIIALGMVVPLAAGYFDVSIAAIAGVTNVAAAALMVEHGQPIWVGMLAALVMGGLLGAANGLLV